MLVAGSVQLTRARRSRSRRCRRRSSRATTSARTRSSRRTLGFSPRRSVVEAVTEHARRSIDVEDRAMLTDPRHYNIRWLELL